jgi:hypothetical protein
MAGRLQLADPPTGRIRFIWNHGLLHYVGELIFHNLTQPYDDFMR